MAGRNVPKNEERLSQDDQKGPPARPQLAKRRCVLRPVRGASERRENEAGGLFQHPAGGVSRGEGQHPSLRLFEEGNYLFTRDSGESVQKLVDGLPPSKYSMSVCTGTRVPQNTGVPPRMSGLEVMSGCFVAAITNPVGGRDSIPADKRMQFHRCGEPRKTLPVAHSSQHLAYSEEKSLKANSDEAK